MLMPDALAGLRAVAGSIRTATAIQSRVVEGVYQNLGEIQCPVVPPGYKMGLERPIIPSYLRGMPLAALKASVDADIQAKDRFVIDGRTFECVIPLTAKTIEIRRKFLAREIQPPERVLYLCLKPEGFDGASNVKPLPELVQVIPFAYITDKPVEIVDQGDGKNVVAQLKQRSAREIARSFFSEENLARLLYCLVVHSDVVVTAEGAR
jgi:hypothetical protein